MFRLQPFVTLLRLSCGLLCVALACVRTAQAQSTVDHVDLPPDANAPGPWHRLVLDPRSGRVFGESAAGGTVEWDGSGWVVLGVGRPAMAAGGTLAYDPTGRSVIRFGGYWFIFFGGLPSDEMWRWDGAAWRSLQPAHRPPPGSGQLMATDPARGRVVLFSHFSAQTWEWDGQDWSERTPPIGPGVRSGAALAYDPSRGRVVLHGGMEPSSGQSLADTWEWDGTSWHAQLAAGGPAVAGPCMAWDPTRRALVLEDVGALWEYAAAGWRSLATRRPLPPLASNSSMEFDPQRRALLVVRDAGIATLIGDVVPAEVNSLGGACGGAGAVPQLDADLPRLGRSAHLELRGANPQRVTLLAVGLRASPFSVGTGCVWSPDALAATLIGTTDPAGAANFMVGVPYALSLRGLELTTQAVVFDPQSGATGLALSEGLRLRLGD